MIHTRYAEQADLARYGLKSDTLAGIDSDLLDDALDAASDIATGLIGTGTRYTMPLTSWGPDLKRAVCHIASLDILTVVGFSYESSDKIYQDRADAALKWLNMVATGAADLVGAVDSTPDVADEDEANEAIVSSDCPRRW